MNTIEQARDVAECLRALTRNRNDGSAYLIAADTIDALIAEFEKVTVERDHVNDVCDSYVAELASVKTSSNEWESMYREVCAKADAELASIKQQEPVGVVVRVDSAMAPGCSYLQGTMIKNTPDGALLYLAAGAQAAPTWTDADIAKMHRLADALDSDEPVQAQERKPLFKEFIIWAEKHGYDCANTCNSDTGEWICLNPMTADLWRAWQAAHGITEQP